MPGVSVAVSTSPGPSALQQFPDATFFVVGMTERGSVLAPTLARSPAEYRQKMGNRVAYGFVDDAVMTYFGEGGTAVQVQRVVGASATTGTLVLVDRAGSPLNTLTVNALSPGSWSGQISVSIANDLVANTFVLTVFLNGVQVERYGNLSSPAAAVTATAVSAYIALVNNNSATAAPNNNPAVLAATVLSTGSDNTGGVTAPTMTAALPNFTAALGGGCVAIPGFPASATATALLSHCQAFNRVALLVGPSGMSAVSAESDAAAFRGAANSQYGGYFYPWILISNGAGGTNTVTPEGYIAGVRARVRQFAGIGGAIAGPWRAPAGIASQAFSVLGLEATAQTDPVNAQALDNNNVNAIRVINNTIRNYGWRSLSTDNVNFNFLSDQDFENYIIVQIQNLLEPYVFGNIDGAGTFFNKMKQDINGFLDGLRQAGGLFVGTDANGNQTDPGYLVDVGPSVNTATSIAQGIAKANVAYRKAGTAALVQVNITKVAINVAL